MKRLAALLVIASLAALLVLTLRAPEAIVEGPPSTVPRRAVDAVDGLASVESVESESERTEATAAEGPAGTDPGIGVVGSRAIDARPLQIEIRTRFRAAAGDPAPGIAVDLHIETASGLLERVGTLETTAGEVTQHEVLVANVDALVEGRARLVGEVRADGFQARRERARAPRGTGPFRLSLSLRPGWSVLGQVVDPSDAPVPAKVKLRAPMNADGSRASNPAFVESRADGRFAVHCAGDVEGVLQVDAGARGAAYEPVTLRADEPDRALRPVVRGASEITVVVDEGGGAPAVGLRLQVHVAELGWDEFGDPARGEALRLAGGGHLEVDATTDANGVARFGGLREGMDYDVLATTRVGARSSRTVPVGVARASVDGTRLEVRLRRPHLRVTAIDAGGEPAKTRLQVADAGEIGDPIQVRGRATRATTEVPDGEAEIHVFEVTEGRQFLVHAEDGLEEGPVLVTVPTGSGGQDVRVRVAARSAVALLRVRSGVDGLSSYSVRLEDIDSGWAIAEESGSGRVRELVLAPFGTYRLVVLGREWRSDRGERPSVRGERLLEVRELGPQEIDVELTRGGWLEVELTGSVESQLMFDAQSRSAWNSLDSTIDIGAAQAVALSLWREGRYYGDVRRVGRAERGAMARFGPSTATVHPQGTTVVSDGLPSGTFELVATVGDGRRWSKTVTIVPGETTRVGLALD